MKNLCTVFVIFVFLKSCISLEHIWHPYHHDNDHHAREELVIANITSDDQFKLDYHVIKWKSLRVEKTCYAAGLMERNVVIAPIKLDAEKKKFSQESYVIELESKPVDIELFEHWNCTLKESKAVLVVATDKNDLLWFILENSNYTLFWSWPLEKNISHINIFQMNHDYHIFVITTFLTQTTADWYEFELEDLPNFWLLQKIPLQEPSTCSAFITTGPHHFFALPQHDSLLVYKLHNQHFLPFQNLTSESISQVISFKIGPKAFLAFDGLDAGIYRLTKDNLVEETMGNSHLDGVNYWLPIHIDEENTILIAQRSLDHGFHESSIVEVITYNGKIFEEHEDIRCLYFGEEILGLSCLPGQESTKGIIGATSIRIDDVLGLLIPRASNVSELFLIKNEIKEIPNPVHKQLEEFVKRREMINDLMMAQEKRYEEIVKSRNINTFDSLHEKIEKIAERMNFMKEALDAVEETHYSTIIFNAPVQIEEEGIFEKITVDTIKRKPADEVFADIVLKNNLSTISSPKIFTNLETENIIAKNINQINTKDFLFTSSDNITITGDLTVEKTLVVSGHINAKKVNEKSLENEIINLDTPIEELKFENVEIRGDASVNELNNFPRPSIDSVFIPYNLEVENVNGENFNKFLQQLCLRNIRNYIPGTTKIEGNVMVRNNAKVTHLNNLKFPEEYVFADHSLQNITGKKYFANSLSTSELQAEGTINNVNTSQVITLTTDQNIPEKTSFKNLKVTESLTVEGQVFGEDASKFLPNPTLLEENIIKANVHFKNLTVEGDIILSENFNSKNFEFLLSDIIYKNEEEAVIESVKQFPEGFKVSTDLSISSNSVNDIDIDSIVTKDTDQTLNITTLHGIVDFGNIDIAGLYDFVDIKKLDEETVKLNGEQYISATFIFENDLTVNELEILESINDFEEDEFVRSTETQEDIDTIEAEQITVEGNVWGHIDDFDLSNFEQRRLSLTKDQEINKDYNIKDLTVEYLEAQKINDTDFYEFTRDSFEDTLKKELKKGKLKIKNMHVQGPLEINRINNQETINLGGSLWKNDIKKFNITEINFHEATFFNTIEIERLSKVNFNLFISNLVFKNEINPKINGVKTFLQGISVKSLIETEKLNNVLLPNILTQQGVQEITCPLVIHGNVSFDKNVTISQNVNNISVTLITENYQASGDEYTVNGDVLFNRLPHISKLKIKGFVNDRSVEDIVDGIVYKDKDFKLPGDTVFENEISIAKNIIVNKTNDVDLAAFASSVVSITKDTDIKSSVRFKEPVDIEKDITILNNLKANLLDGIDINTWTENAIFINKGLLSGNYKFDQVQIVGNLQTEYLNDIDMNTLIPLRSQQNLSDLTFEEITTFKDIQVGNSTNFQDLRTEYNNTVLASSQQDIDSDVDFVGNVFVEGDMEVAGLLNGKEIDNIVTANTDQQLTAIYNFRSKVTLEKNLLVEHLINGINISKWLNEGVKVKSSAPENITNNWLIHGELILEDDVTGSGLINGVNLEKFRQEIELKRNYKYALEKGFIDDYRNICKDLTYMYDKVKRQIYKFNYLENGQVLELKNRIQHVYHFNYSNNIYLLIAEEKSCESHIYIFDGEFQWMKKVHFGIISQIISVHDNDLNYLVIKNKNLRFCDVEGTNVWQLVDDNFSHLLNLEDQDVLQESLIPGTFYGIKGYIITEFKILPELEPRLRKYRKWQVKEENMAFVPRGFSTGLAVSTGKKLIRLNREDPIVEDFHNDVEGIIIGTFTEEFNPYLPGRVSGDLVALKITGKKTLLAVASHEETSVKGSVDFIKIYEDVVNGRVFHKVATYKPSSLVTLNFNNGETLLVFMEDERVLQVYEYKGIEGFKHKFAVKVEGSKLMVLSAEVDGNRQTLLGLVNKNKIIFMEAVMLGNKVEDGLYCYL